MNFWQNFQNSKNKAIDYRPNTFSNIQTILAAINFINWGIKTMLRKFTRILLISTAMLAILWFIGALALVFWPAPKFTRSTAAASGNNLQTAKGPDNSPMSEATQFRMRDGTILKARWFASDSSINVLFLHGVMGSSRGCAEICRRIREMTGAEVFALDQRGHGESGGVPGDVNYIGQYEDDVSDVIAELRKRKSGSYIILAGHSMGGGIALRYVAARKKPAGDGYLLFAPLLGSKSPTARTESADGQRTGGEAWMKLNLPRTIGLMMLNAVGIGGLNGLHTLLFNVPPQFPLRAYSYRAMASMEPNDYVAALTADTKPLLVIVGKNDEAFRAEQFASVMGIHKHAETEVIEGESHNSILNSSAALNAVAGWMRHMGADRKNEPRF
jgi:pimeloyl-ACP methyl ester carboxylesterase